MIRVYSRWNGVMRPVLLLAFLGACRKETPSPREEAPVQRYVSPREALEVVDPIAKTPVLHPRRDDVIVESVRPCMDGLKWAVVHVGGARKNIRIERNSGGWTVGPEWVDESYDPKTCGGGL